MPDQEAAGGRTVGGRKRRKLKQLDGGKTFDRATERVQELTIEDLEQLAQVADGSATATAKLQELDAEDLRSLDEAFHQAKLQAADNLAGALQGEGVADQEIFDGWSCCCCTPCCCCAAADVDPFEPATAESP